MIRTVTFGCSLPKAKADALILESGAVYTRVLVEHYRIYRHTGHWLSVGAASRIEDQLSGPTTLHTATSAALDAHSRDAAQQAFYKAIKTARTNRENSLDGTPTRSNMVSHSVGQRNERSNASLAEGSNASLAEGSSGPSLTREKESVVPRTRGKWLLQGW